MLRKYKIVEVIIFTVVTVSIILIGTFAIRIAKYHSGFPRVKIGQQKQEVINLMGQESESKNCDSSIRKKYPDIDCSEIFAYYSILDYWAIAFDKDGNVIKKYSWTFDDGYGKAHDFD